MPVFRSRHQADLLTLLLLHPDEEYTLTELADRVGVPLTTAHRELARLAGAGLLAERSLGRSRLLRANSSHRAFGPLSHLLLITFGPHLVVAEEFAELPRVTRVLIYGSWAARYQGVAGGEPGDVDVLVVGSPDRAEVYAAAERAETRLGVTVNPTVRSTARWEMRDDSLVQSIRANPIVVVSEFDEASATAPTVDTVMPR